MRAPEQTKGGVPMDDKEIVGLYRQRDEAAIKETETKYSAYLEKIAFNILNNSDDSREVANEAYLAAWKSIPPNNPEKLSTYLGKITRQTAIDVLRKRNSKKRQDSQYILSLSELEECVPEKKSVENELDERQLAAVISTFLRTLNNDMRNAFVCRYYFGDSVSDIAGYLGASQSKIHSILHRVRKALKAYLEKEGYTI